MDPWVRCHGMKANPTGYQTWGELIVNANALIMHSFFPVIQGNDQFTSFCTTLMLIQCITLVKIHCITCITLNYCLTVMSLLKTNCRVLNPQQEDDHMKGLPDRQEWHICIR